MLMSGYLNDEDTLRNITVDYSMFFAFGIGNNTGLQGFLPLIYTD